MSKAIMIDMETLSTSADGVIVSLGAVKFDLRTGEVDDAAFYAAVSLDSNLELGRRIDESTFSWWQQQSDAARAVFSEPKSTLEVVLNDFTEWFGDERQEIWSNGADFDIPMLAHAYKQLGMTAPWQFFNARCYRTMKNLPLARNVPKPANPVKHNALQDAIYQAKHLISIWKVMQGCAAERAS